MAKRKRVFREWQHPRDGRGRFTDGAGSASWARRAEEKFKASAPSVETRSPGGRPQISRAAKGAALFEAQREGARPSAVRAPKAAKSAAPPVKNLEAFNAPDRKRRPSTFELGPKSASSSGADRPAPKKLAAPGTGTPRVVPAKPVKGPLSQKTVEGLSEERLNQGITMNGTDSPKGRQLVAELARRELLKRQGEKAPAARPSRAEVAATLNKGSAVDTPRDSSQTGGMTTTRGQLSADVKQTVTGREGRAVKGVDMTDPNRWNSDRRMQFASSAKYELGKNGGGGNNLLDDDQRTAVEAAIDEFGRIPSWETQRLDAAARKIQAFRDENEARKADFMASRKRLSEAASGRLVDKEEFAKAEARNVKKAYGIPGDAAIKKLPDGQRRLAESIVFDAKNVGRVRAAARNNEVSGELIRAELKRADLHPRTRQETQKLLDGLPHMANSEGVLKSEASLQPKIDAWTAVRAAAGDGDPGPKGDYNFEIRSGDGLSREQADELTILGRQDGTALAERAAARLRGDSAKPSRAEVAQTLNAPARKPIPRGTKETAATRQAALTALAPKPDYTQPSQRDKNLTKGAGEAMVANMGEGTLASRRPTPKVDHLGLSGEPSSTDVIRAIRDLPKAMPTPGETGPGGYANMKRHTLVSLAHAAGVDHRGSNTEIAARLHAADVAKAAKLNPSGVGRHPGYDSIDPAHLDVILGDNGIEHAGMSLEQKRAALAAHDKRIGVARFALGEGEAVSTPDQAASSSLNRTEIGGWKGGRTPGAQVARPSGDTVNATLKGVGTREEGAAYLDNLKLSKVELKALADELNVPVNSSYSAARIKESIVQQKVGARLNFSAIMDSGNIKRDLTPEAAPAAPPRRLQTFADRMAGGMSERDRLNARLENERRREQLRAQETERARQRAEAEANDTRTEREKLTEQLQQDRDVDYFDRRYGRPNPQRMARMKKIEARLAELDTEDRKAKLKALGAVKGDRVKTSIGEFEVTGKTPDGYLRVLRPDGRRGSVDPKNVEGVTKAPKAEAAQVAAPVRGRFSGDAKRGALAREEISATEIKPGDRLLYRNVPTTILSGPAEYSDRFGQKLMQFQARREDTGKEGTIVFGPTGRAVRVDTRRDNSQNGGMKTDEQISAEGQARRDAVRAKLDNATTQQDVDDALHGQSTAALQRILRDLGGSPTPGIGETSLRRSIGARVLSGKARTTDTRPRSKLAHSQDSLLRANAAALDELGPRLHTPAGEIPKQGDPGWDEYVAAHRERNNRMHYIGREHDSPYGVGTSGDAGAKLAEKGYIRVVPGQFLPEITEKGRAHIAATSPTPRPVKAKPIEAGTVVASTLNRPRTGTFTGDIKADRAERLNDKAFTDHVKMLTLTANTGDQANAWGFGDSDQPVQVGDEVMVNTFDRLRRGIVTQTTRGGSQDGTTRIAYATPSGGYVQETTAPTRALWQLNDPAKRPGANRAALLPPLVAGEAGSARPRGQSEETKARVKVLKAEQDKAYSIWRRRERMETEIDRILDDKAYAEKHGETYTAADVMRHYPGAIVDLAEDLGIDVPRRKADRDVDALRAEVLKVVLQKGRPEKLAPKVRAWYVAHVERTEAARKGKTGDELPPLPELPGAARPKA